MSLKSSFNQYLIQKYPHLKAEQLDLLVAEQLISPFQVTLPASTIENIKNEIKSYWKLRSWSENNLAEKYETFGLKKPTNFSACMSYDFHINAGGGLELIEINTNAAFLALGLELYSFWNLQNVAGPFSDKDLVEMFLNEIRLSSGKTNTSSIAIFDESPETQRLYIEFLIYKQIFEKYGLKADILDFPQVSNASSFDLLYNRYTDFYLQTEKSAELKSMFNAGQVHLSPNPWEYFLLADKQRLIDWYSQNDIEKPSSLLPIYDLSTVNKDEIWSQRKSLFFKPKNSFGSKQAYRGSSISKTHYENIANDGFVAQQISAPAEVQVDLSGITTKLKYDLRCYAYQNQLQLVVARLYQGQTTNLRTEGGGFACIKFS